MQSKKSIKLRIKGMENAVAYKDMEIDETLSQLKSIKGIKKMQEKSYKIFYHRNNSRALELISKGENITISKITQGFTLKAERNSKKISKKISIIEKKAGILSITLTI